MVIASQDILEDLLSESGLEFAPGLLDVFQSTTPPTILWFKKLPTYIEKCWGVYLLVLEKGGYRPKIYIGSGTNSEYGLRKRLECYDKKSVLPVGVKQALDDGYTIVHKGLLCWCPIPAATLRFVIRILLIAIEAIFSVMLKAMKHQTTNYGMPRLFSWSDMEYDGCCSHSSLLEAVVGEGDGLTPEEIAAKYVEMEQRRPEQRRAKQSKYKQSDRGRAKQAVSAKKVLAKNKATRKYGCDLCDVAFQTAQALNDHNASQRHLNAAAGIPKGPRSAEMKARADTNIANNTYHCKPCNKSFGWDSKLQSHKKTQKHKDKAAAAAESESSS